MAPTKDATSTNPSDRVHNHPTWLKVLFFPFYLFCFAACWSTSGGDALRIAKWLGTSVATAAATTGVTYQTTMWLVPALQHCEYGVPPPTVAPAPPQYPTELTWKNIHKRETLPNPANLLSNEQASLSIIKQLLTDKKPYAPRPKPAKNEETEDTPPAPLSNPPFQPITNPSSTKESPTEQDPSTTTTTTILSPTSVPTSTPEDTDDTSPPEATPCQWKNNLENATFDAIVWVACTFAIACFAYRQGERKKLKTILYYQDIASDDRRPRSPTHYPMNGLATYDQTAQHSLPLPLPPTPLVARQ